jgi:pimeloyl-ACP methyl ester carboxylesterase
MIEQSLLGHSPAGLHRVHFTVWGAHEQPQTVICVHGMTRNGRDFDALAQTLEPDCRVVCPDVVGRGRSDWLRDPVLYGYPQYLADMTALIAHLDVPQVDWIGTSMGGLIGLFLAAQPHSPIARLVLNDIGPFIPKAALERIVSYAGADESFADLADLETYLRVIYRGFGPLLPAQWHHLATHSARRDGDGRFRLAHDPAITVPLKAAPLSDVDLWSTWEQVRCPVLVLRGAESDLLLPETFARMQAGKHNVIGVEIPHVGHAPMLMDPEQQKVIRDFLMV